MCNEYKNIWNFNVWESLYESDYVTNITQKVVNRLGWNLVCVFGATNGQKDQLLVMIQIWVWILNVDQF